MSTFRPSTIRAATAPTGIVALTALAAVHTALAAGARPLAAQASRDAPGTTAGTQTVPTAATASVDPEASRDTTASAVPARQAQEAKATVHAFHEALAAGDSAGALSLLHPDVRVFESGHAETLEEYRSGHLSADMAFSASVDREVLEEEEVVGGAGGQALYLGRARVRGTFRGREVDAVSLETVVLARSGDGWRIRHIHWSSR